MAKVGRWETQSDIQIDADSFKNAITNVLKEYGDEVYKATEESLDAVEKVLIDNLKAATPVIKKPPKGYIDKKFKSNWKSTKRKYKLVRFIGNTTTVKGEGDTKIALSNIFEYSTTRGNPFISETFNNSVDEMAKAAVNVFKERT